MMLSPRDNIVVLRSLKGNETLIGYKLAPIASLVLRFFTAAELLIVFYVNNEQVQVHHHQVA
jgi:hypothetical protein